MKFAATDLTQMMRRRSSRPICENPDNLWISFESSRPSALIRVKFSRDVPAVVPLFRKHHWRRTMKPFMSSIAAIIGLGLLTAGPLSARGPGGGGGFGAPAGTSNAPRAGQVAAPYGLYTA